MPVSSPHPAIRIALLAILFVTGMAGYPGSFGVMAQREASGCVLEPLSLPLFDATPAARIAATPATSAPTMDVGEDVILAAVEDIVDCINTGDPALQYAIFTQHYLAGQFAGSSMTYQPAFEQQLSLGPADVEQSFDLVGISDVTVPGSGFVSVTIELSSGGSTYRDTLELANVDGVWLIDSIEELNPPG